MMACLRVRLRHHPPPVAADVAVPGEAPPPTGLPLDGSVAAALGMSAAGSAYLGDHARHARRAFMSLGDVLPIPIGRDLGQLYYPEVLAEPLLSKPVSVSFHMIRGSFFEIRTVGERDERGLYRIPTQPFRANIPGDQGMFVVNLCTASVGFLHQLAEVGSTRSLSCSVDILATGFGAVPAPNISIRDANNLCNGHPLPRAASAASPTAPPTSVVPAALDIDPAVLVPLPAAVPAPPTSPNFDVLDLDILPVAPEPLRSLGDAECLITSVTIPLLPLPLGSPELPDVDVAPLELSDVAALPPPKKTRLPATSTMIPTPAATEDAVGKRRSSRLRAKEAPLRETVADQIS